MSLSDLVSAWTSARKRLEAAGVDSPVIDARLLVEAAAGVSRKDLITDPHRPLTGGQEARLEMLLSRRERREPISHILGKKGFWTITLDIDANVLTPRPESEVLVDAVLRGFDVSRPFDLIDLGVGSGALLLAILSERPLSRGVGVDISEPALGVARRNAENLGLTDRIELRHGDWAADLEAQSADVVVANPPYIRSGDIAALAPEVRDHEPRVALDGGPDGLDAYRLLAKEVLRLLRPGGFFALEIGAGQGREVAALMVDAGAGHVSTAKDLSGHERVVLGNKKSLGAEAATR